MAEFVKQGEVDLSGTILYTGGTSTTLTKIIALRFYNSVAYVLTLERYDAVTATSEVMYGLTLDAGDTVTDNLSYALNSGDQIIVYSDVPGTTYYVYGIDYASS
jgi:hypothetical protein